MNYHIVIVARANSSRLPGKNLKQLMGKPLIEYSIDYALNYYPKDLIWVNSDDQKILELANKNGVNAVSRPSHLALDEVPTVDVLKFQIDQFSKNNVPCDAVILLQPTNPLREKNLLTKAIDEFEKSKKNSLATFSSFSKKIGTIKKNQYKPLNYKPGQRSQDLKDYYFENGSIYITKTESILNGKVVTDDVYPLICDAFESTIDIDTIEDFIFAESIMKFNNEK